MVYKEKDYSFLFGMIYLNRKLCEKEDIPVPTNGYSYTFNRKSYKFLNDIVMTFSFDDHYALIYVNAKRLLYVSVTSTFGVVFT